jgi:hypothetical protein
MKSSFANADQAVVPTETVDQVPANAVQTETQVAVAAPTELAPPDSYFANDGVEGDFDKSDIKMPRISVVQSVGPLSGELGFLPGTIVYNKETVLGTPFHGPDTPNGKGPIIGTDGLIVTLVALKKYFLEDLPYDPASMDIPQYFKTLEDARRAGFLPSQDKREMGPDHRYVKPVADADFLIRGTDKNITFPLDFNGTPYAKARWTLQSTAYSRVGKQLFTDSQLALRNGLTTKFYTISVRREKLGANWVFVPKATLTGMNTPEFQTWIKSCGL